MPAAPKNGPSLFLGLELATDQLRASIVDESLELVGVECVDFDTELPEYQLSRSPFFLAFLTRTLTGRKAVYSQRLEMRTRRLWICGSRLLVRFAEPNFLLSMLSDRGSIFPF